MHEKLTLKSALFIFGIPISIILTSIFLALNLAGFGTDQSTLSMAITLDLAFTAPLVYLFLIRKRNIPKFTFMPFFIGGLVIASFVIPAQEQYTLDLIKSWVLPIVEITVVSLVIYKVSKIRKVYKQNRAQNMNFLTAVKLSTSELFPAKVANALTTEIGMVYYGLFKWRRAKLAENEFSYHKESGIIVLLSVILGVALIELFVVHLLLEASYPTVTWILSILSAYSVIQIFGLIKSIPYTPITIADGKLTIRMGTFQETTIPLSEIDRIEFTSNDYPEEDKSYQKIIFAGHNAILHLKTEGTIHGFMGIKKNYQHLVFSVDDKQRFKNYLANEI